MLLCPGVVYSWILPSNEMVKDMLSADINNNGNHRDSGLRFPIVVTVDYRNQCHFVQNVSPRVKRYVHSRAGPLSLLVCLSGK